MKIDRLIGILSILLQKEKVTAPYLADKFEVSRRTINRDIEDICKAGIPIVTTRGVNGGISIMEGYRMDKTLLTSREMQSILAGLRSLLEGARQGYPSIYADLRDGRKTEVDAISGSVVRSGHKNGVPVPSHEMVVELVHAMEGKTNQTV